MTLAKGLGAGVPIGAMIAFGHAPSTLMGAGMHGTTFGGNPLAAAAGATTLETIRKEGLMENARTVGARIAAALAGVDAVAEVRQYGLHIGLDLDPSSSVLSGIGAPAKELVTIARENHHMIINATGEHTLRLAPPLNLTTAEADAFLTRFTASLKDLPR